MVNFGLITQQQALSDSVENRLLFDMFEIIAPPVERELDLSDEEPMPKSHDQQSDSNEEGENDPEDMSFNERERSYRRQVKAHNVCLPDVKVILMAVLKLNDGKKFMEGKDAPLPQSEGEIGFRKDDDVFSLRYEELSRLQKHFNVLYLNQL